MATALPFFRFVLASTLPALICLSAPSPASAAEPVLPGTQPLTLTQPLDELMVAGIDRFALAELAASPGRRDRAWPRASSSPEAQRRNIAPLREKLRALIGAVDPRLPAVDFELLGSIDVAPRIGASDRFSVFAVRWRVLEGLSAEGLLLQPAAAPTARLVVLPDADWSPEAFCGLGEGVPASAQLPRRLAAHGCQVLVPALLSRSDRLSGSKHGRFTNQPHREFIYRQAFEVGRHVIGYEVQIVLAAVDVFAATNTRAQSSLPLGVAGVGEGGLLALYSAALDERLDRALVCGYFQPREAIWQEPIYRNLWGLLSHFGDAELAGLIAPRRLTIEACAAPEVSGPPPATAGRAATAAPGRIATPPLAAVQAEFARAKPLFAQLGAADRLVLAGSGNGPAGSPAALAALLPGPLDSTADSATVRSVPPPKGLSLPNEPLAREQRLFEEMQAHIQTLARLSSKVRDAKWQQADRSSLARWQATVGPLREWACDEFIGRLPPSTVPLNPRTRLVPEAPWLAGHGDAFSAYEVVLDVYPDIIATGILLLPRNLAPGERRPVVVTQHGLEGTPEDTITGPSSPRYKSYQAFSAELAKKDFIVYAPQNPYRGGDRFRTLQRKSNPLGRSLYSYIIPQHERTLEWLAGLPFVDPERIAFYGLSYGGKTAMRVPPFVPRYCLAICSGDFNEWIRKITTVEDRPGYAFSGEYEIVEWNMAHVANYAELACLLTPRPFMVERGHDDGVALDEWVAWEFAKVQRHYDKLGLANRTEIEFFNGPHTIHGQGTFRFLEKHLR